MIGIKSSIPHTGLALIGLSCLIILSAWSLTVGSSEIAIADLLQGLSNPNEFERTSIILWEVRLPRLLAGIAAGACLAVAGAIMQAVTHNPLADPGLLGVNAGAAFAVVVSLTIFGDLSNSEFIWIAFAGAAAVSLLVYAVGSVGRSGATPLKLVLAGVIVGSFLHSITAGILMIDAQTLDSVRFWTIGSLKNRGIDDVLPLTPFFIAGLVSAMVFSRQLNTLSLGANIAASLGQNIVLWRLLLASVIVVLASSAVSVTGPLGFVGLVVPHIIRLCIGNDYRWVIPLSALLGSILVILGDTLPRAIWDNDVPVGVMMALIGAPFFVYLARQKAGEAI